MNLLTGLSLVETTVPSLVNVAVTLPSSKDVCRQQSSQCSF